MTTAFIELIIWDIISKSWVGALSKITIEFFPGYGLMTGMIQDVTNSSTLDFFGFSMQIEYDITPFVFIAAMRQHDG
jgi:hypothetical protein